MVSGRGWRQSGAVKYSAAEGRRAASSLQSGSLPSTLEARSERFPRRCRLTREEDILRVRAEGVRFRTPLFDVRSLPSTVAHSRIAVIVPRFGETAVARNKVKRRLRELSRKELLPSLTLTDVVIRANPAAYRAVFDQLRVRMSEVRLRLAAKP